MYIVLRTSNYYNRCLLAEFDSTGEGYLHEDEVITWIVDLMLKFPSSSRGWLIGVFVFFVLSDSYIE